MTGNETLVVGAVNEFGFRVGDKQYNISPKYNGPKAAVGMVLEAVVYTSPKGAKYVNSAAIATQGVVAPASVPANARAPEPKKPYKKPEARAEAEPNWDAINRGKTASLFVEAILSNPNLSQSLDQVSVDAIAEVVDPLVDFVFGTRKDGVK